MKICYITREYPPELPTAGIGTYTKTIATLLASRGHEVHIICGTTKATEYEYFEDGVHVYRLPWQRIGRFNILPHLKYCVKVAQKAKRIYETKGIDIIEVPDYLGQGIFLKLFGTRCPIVVRFHGGQEIELMTRIPLRPSFYLVFLQEIIASWCSTAGSSPSIFMASVARKKCYFRSVSILPNFISEKCFRNKSLGDSQPLKDRIIFVGRLDEAKGPHLLSKAVVPLFEWLPDLEIIFIGRNIIFKKEKVLMSDYCLSLIPEGNRNNMFFLDYLPRDQVIDYLSEGGIFCLPSLYESFGLVAIEALMCGLPVVGFTDTALDEIVIDGQTGMLVTKGDVEALSEALRRLLSDRELRTKMGFRGREMAVAKFSEKSAGNITEAYYLSFLSRYGLH